MRIRDNWLSLLSWRTFTGASAKLDKSITNLSSGLRVNSAADGTAELAISERMRAQVRGLIQANRNALDGISLVQTGEGALQEVSAILQRGRELSLQAANGTWTTQDRQQIQDEINQLLQEVDRTADQATFNGTRLLSPSDNNGAIANILNGLQSSWLKQTEDLVQQYYGLVGDGATLKIALEATGSEGAWISGTSNATTGKLDDLTLHINLSDFGSVGGPDGGTGPIYNDRKVARALTQAILARNTNYAYVDAWFKSGVADYIAGRNELLQSDVTQYGAAAVVNAMSDALGTWTDDGLHRSSAYVAVRYLASQLPPSTMVSFMDALKTSGGTVDSAMLATIGYSVTDFINDFLANGQAFLGTVNLAGSDVGGIGGGDAHAVIPNPPGVPATPLNYLAVDWSSLGSSGSLSSMSKPLDFTLQVGANKGDTLSFSIPVVTTLTLSLIGIDVVSHADKAFKAFDGAIKSVSKARGTFGSVNNELEHTINTNTQNTISNQESISRIRDLDFAREVTNMARQQILVSSSGSMLAQANKLRQNVMWLLNGASAGKSSASML